MSGKIFKRIGEILEGNLRIINYTITGYKFTETRLVLHFRDCNQVFDFEEIGDEIIETRFYTKDWVGDEWEENNLQFRALHKKETKEETSI